MFLTQCLRLFCLSSTRQKPRYVRHHRQRPTRNVPPCNITRVWRFDRSIDCFFTHSRTSECTCNTFLTPPAAKDDEKMMIRQTKALFPCSQQEYRSTFDTMAVKKTREKNYKCSGSQHLTPTYTVLISKKCMCFGWVHPNLFKPLCKLGKQSAEFMTR